MKGLSPRGGAEIKRPASPRDQPLRGRRRDRQHRRRFLQIERPGVVERVPPDPFVGIEKEGALDPGDRTDRKVGKMRLSPDGVCTQPANRRSVHRKKKRGVILPEDLPHPRKKRLGQRPIGRPVLFHSASPLSFPYFIIHGPDR